MPFAEDPSGKLIIVKSNSQHLYKPAVNNLSAVYPEKKTNEIVKFKKVDSLWNKTNFELKDFCFKNTPEILVLLDEGRILNYNFSKDEASNYIYTASKFETILVDFSNHPNLAKAEKEMIELNESHFRNYYETGKESKQLFETDSNLIMWDFILLLPILLLLGLLFSKKWVFIHRKSKVDSKNTILIPRIWIRKVYQSLIIALLFIFLLESSQISEHRKYEKRNELCYWCSTEGAENFFKTGSRLNEVFHYEKINTWKGVKLNNEGDFNWSFYSFILKSIFIFDLKYLILFTLSLSIPSILYFEFKKKYRIVID